MKKFLFLFLAFVPGFIKSQSMSEIKSAVSFVYVKDSLGNPIPNGTCFFVAIKSKTDSLITYPYLVTAKHVLKKNDTSYYKEILIRMNTIDSSSKYTFLPIFVNSAYKNVFFHSDSTVDIAIIPYVPPKKDYMFSFLDTSFLCDRNHFNAFPITEGTEAFFTGLFTPYVGDRKIYPIVRFGRIALMTNERIDWVGMKREMLLVETSSFGGNSGSPIYFKLVYPNGNTQLLLGGVLSGTYRDAAEIVFTTNGKHTPFAIYNNGISGVTPVYLLQEILFNEEVSSLRN